MTTIICTCRTRINLDQDLLCWNGNPDQELLGWINQFETAFCVFQHNHHKDSKSKNEAMAHCLRSQLAEPVKSRVIMEIKDNK